MQGLRPLVHVKINGKDATLLLDSGSFFSALEPGAMEKFGLTKGEPPEGMYARGLGGKSVGLTVGRADTFDIADSHFHKADFFVFEEGVGQIADGVLGQNLLGVADIEYDLANGMVRLFQPHDCEQTRMAYWVTDQPYSVIDFEPVSLTDMSPTAMASIDGAPIRVDFDTGAEVSMLSTERAAKVGVKPGGAGVIEASSTGGISRHAHVQSWIGPFDSLKLGDEEIRHIRLRFGDMNLPDQAEMLLGDDFFLSHRVFVSYSQRKMYFTYNGGPVFNLDAGPHDDAPPPAASATPGAPTSADLGAGPPAPAGPYSDVPTDADGFARRGEASTARRDYAAAIADLTKAIALNPKNADYLVARAQAEAKAEQNAAAQADLDLALKLKPGDTDILFARADFHIGEKDKTAARADLDALDKALARDSDDRLRLADYYEFVAAYADGVAQADRWMAAHPKSDQRAQAFNARCWLRALGGLDLDKALADCDAALRLAPDSPDIIDSRGLVRLRMGDLDAAIADYSAALRANPAMAATLYARGVAEMRKGLKAAGEADQQAALRLDPKVADWAKERNIAP